MESGISPTSRRLRPGLTFSPQNNFGTPQANIEIRGIQSRTSAPTTGIYLDDTPLVGRANNVNIGLNSAYPQVFDLDRVEVLRGPQGTLFGASSEGGAVRFITKQPDLTQSSLYARSEIGETRYGGRELRSGIAGGTPLIEDKLAFRASVWYRHDRWLCRPRATRPWAPAPARPRSIRQSPVASCSNPTRTGPTPRPPKSLSRGRRPTG